MKRKKPSPLPRRARRPGGTLLCASLLAAVCFSGVCVRAGVYNIRVVTDASPDYHDLPGLIRSITAGWETPEEKCWALFYWTHLARRQTSPMTVHGVELTDPIRQFCDYGYAMCSTVAGMNCSIWRAMGFDVRFWDIHAHTVSEVFYDGAWHMYDDSMSAIYTLCDGKTIAGVEDIGKDGGCEACGGRIEPGHIARYHCLCAGGPDSFLTGADCARSLEEEARCFRPGALKHRWYYLNQDRGHRYILNLRPGEVYTRYYASRGSTPEYYVPLHGRDPEATNPRYRIRGNGLRTFRPALTPGSFHEAAHSSSGVVAIDPAGIQPSQEGQVGEAVFKVEGANVITSLELEAKVFRESPADAVRLWLSTTSGSTWKEVWVSDAVGSHTAERQLIEEINGSYEALVKVTLRGAKTPGAARLEALSLRIVTMLNSKTQPRLSWGENTVYVGAGTQTESIVLWPDLRAGRYDELVVDQKNIASDAEARGYQGVLYAARPREEAYVVFRIDAPRPIVRLVYGGRLYNRAPDSRIEFLHSFDGGATWTQSYSLVDTKPPWDVIHHEEVDTIPAGTRSVLCKYRMSGAAAGSDACSIYSLRMEASHLPPTSELRPLEVTFNWSEIEEDDSLRPRSHTQLVKELPFTYKLNVGGMDHPVMDELRIRLKAAGDHVEYGYSDGQEVPATRHTPTWVTYGRNLARGKAYTVSVPSNDRWGAGDPDGTKLTDGVVGPNYAGGIGPRYALCWDAGDDPVITVDLGRSVSCGGFRIHLGAGWPWWDATRGEVQDQVELLTSLDGEAFLSRGFFDLRLRRKEIPINHMMPDDETATAFTYDLAPQAPISARFVRYRVTARRTLTVSEVMVLDDIHVRPFDPRITLPGTSRTGEP